MISPDERADLAERGARHAREKIELGADQANAFEQLELRHQAERDALKAKHRPHEQRPGAPPFLRPVQLEQPRITKGSSLEGRITAAPAAAEGADDGGDDAS